MQSEEILEPTAWTRWYDQRPQDSEALYWWRIAPCNVLGLQLQPEWTDKMHYCGMGYSDNEWWPPHSRWDGYNRSVPKTTEWALASPTLDRAKLTPKLLRWQGLDLEPCPWTGVPPKVDYSGRWVTAPPYQPEYLILNSRWGTTRWQNAESMRKAWNNRAPVNMEAA